MVEVERFDVHLIADKGRKIVFGSALIGGGAVLAGLILSQPILVIVALIAFAVTLYNFPRLGRIAPHLSATLYGLAIDGLGTVDWSSIETLELSEESARPVLHFILSRPLDGALKEAGDLTALRSVQVNIWHLENPQTLSIDLGKVQEPARDILHSFRRFHARATRQTQVI